MNRLRRISRPVTADDGKRRNPRQWQLWLAVTVLIAVFPIGTVATHAGAVGVTWGSAIEIPGTGVLNAGGNATASKISCTAPTTGNNCAVVGTYTDSAGKIRPFVEDEFHGQWGNAFQIPNTSNYAVTYAYLAQLDISCTTPGSVGNNCAVAGMVTTNLSAGTREFVVDEVNGTWGNAQLLNYVFPGWASTFTNAISCTTPGLGGNNCGLSGAYFGVKTVGGQGIAGPQFVADEVNGVWGAASDVALPVTDAQAYLELERLSCTTAGTVGNNCVATGSLKIRGGNIAEAYVLAETNGTWGVVQPIIPAASIHLNSVGQLVEVGYMTGLSCTSPGNCEVAMYYTSTTTNQIFTDTEIGGVWETPLLLQNLPSGWSPANLTLSCSTPGPNGGNCAMAGAIRTTVQSNGLTSTTTQTYVDDEVNGTWMTPMVVPGSEALNVGGASYANVSCALPGSLGNNCGVVGTYTNAAHKTSVWVTDEANGTWSNVVQLPGIGALGVGGANAVNISCATVSSGVVNCGFAGGYVDASGHSQAWVTDATGTPLTPATVPTITNIPAGALVGGSFFPDVATNGDGAKSVTSTSPSICAVNPITGVVTYLAVGTCVLVSHVAAGSNYGAADGTSQTFTVGQGTLYVVPENQSITHLTSAPTGSFYTFKYYADAAHTIQISSYIPTTAPTCSSSYASTDATGTVDQISCTGGTDANYLFDTTAIATLTVTAGTIYAVPSDISLTYGSSVPTSFTITYYSDPAHTIVVTPTFIAAPTCQTSYTPTTNVGTYNAAISCQGGRDANDVIDASALAKVTVTKATLYVVPSDQSLSKGSPSPDAAFYIFKYFADPSHTIEVTSIGFDASTSCGSTYDAAAVLGSTFPITCTTSTTSLNFNLDVSATANLEVTPATIYAVPVNIVLPYGSPVIASSSYTLAYFSDPDHTQPLFGFTPTEAPTCTSNYTPTTDVGTLSGGITCSGGSDSTYIIDSASTADVIVTKATFYVKPENKILEYGATAPDSSFYTFGYYSDSSWTNQVATIPNAVAAPTCTSSYSSSTPTGVYPGTITCAGGGDANFQLDDSGTANLTVTATPVYYVDPSDVQLTYGTTAPSSSFYSYTIYSDSAETQVATPSVTVAPTCTSSYTSTTNVGSYSETVTCSGGAVTGGIIDTSSVGDVTVTRATPTSPTISNPPTSPRTGDSFAPIIVTNGDGATGVESETPSVCSVDLNTGLVTFLAPGTCTLRATVAEGDNYFGSVGPTTSFTVTDGPASSPYIENLPISGIRGESFLPIVVTDSNGTISVTSSTPEVCRVDPSTGAVRFVGVGTCTLVAHVAASADFSASDGVAQSFPVYVGVASIPTIINLPGTEYVSGHFLPRVSTDGDGARTVTSSTPDVCIVDPSSGIVNFVGVGTCTLVAHVADGQRYSGADGVNQSFSVTATPPVTPPPTTTSTTPTTTTTLFKVPAAPTSVVATASGTSVRISWATVAGAMSYTVTASPGGKSCSTADLACVIDGLTRGVSYVFSVVATNQSGAGVSGSGDASIAPVRHFEVVPFAVDSYSLDATLKAQVRAIARAVVAGKYQKVSFTGFTDITGSAAHNAVLSTERATSVSVYLKDVLERLGVTRQEVSTLGLGSAHPKVLNDRTASLKASRRVEVTLG